MNQIYGYEFCRLHLCTITYSDAGLPTGFNYGAATRSAMATMASAFTFSFADDTPCESPDSSSLRAACELQPAELALDVGADWQEELGSGADIPIENVEPLSSRNCTALSPSSPRTRASTCCRTAIKRGWKLGADCLEDGTRRQAEGKETC